MTEMTLASRASYLIEVAGRAPSVHNTQPWRFAVSREAIELHADVSRQLRVDPDDREMVLSCGAALYGLRLAVRSLGRLPDVELLPGPRALARVRLGLPAPMTAEERTMLAAVSHRHTHRGPFEPGPLPAGKPGRLPQRDFDLGQGIGMLPGGGPAPPVTAVLLTPGDGERDWLRAGQALHRLLLRAASRWVFARLNTQPLEDTATRTRVRTA